MDIMEDNIFNNDVLYMKSLVGKCVKLSTRENQFITGTVYIIDPVYKTVVLHSKVPEAQGVRVSVVFQQAIKSFELMSDEIDESYLLKQSTPSTSVQDLNRSKKKQLKKWLQKMHIDTDEVGDTLKIGDHLLILAPYGLDNCICNNTLMLEKIRNIISLMPNDFDNIQT